MNREQFRALEIKPNGGEHWVISDSMKWFGDALWLMDEDDSWKQCYPKTRSVSYGNMIDKNGKKIFASLNEDGVGGDICALIPFPPKTAIFNGMDGLNISQHINHAPIGMTVIGIHKG